MLPIFFNSWGRLWFKTKKGRLFFLYIFSHGCIQPPTPLILRITDQVEQQENKFFWNATQKTSSKKFNLNILLYLHPRCFSFSFTLLWAFSWLDSSSGLPAISKSWRLDSPNILQLYKTDNFLVSHSKQIIANTQVLYI